MRRCSSMILLVLAAAVTAPPYCLIVSVACGAVTPTVVANTTTSPSALLEGIVTLN